MKLLIDDAHISTIKRLYEYYPVEGVTTNPSILAKTGRPPYDVLREIRNFIGADAELHVQAVAGTAEKITEEAHAIIRQLGDRTLIKIPCIPEGFKAMMALRKEGIRITGTAVYMPLQAFLAAQCGAEYVAPYITRIDHMGYDGVNVAKQIQDIFRANQMSAKIIAASFKCSQQVLALCQYGIHAVTVAPDVIEHFARNAAVTAAVDDFTRDFISLVGEGKTMSDCS